MTNCNVLPTIKPSIPHPLATKPNFRKGDRLSIGSIKVFVVYFQLSFSILLAFFFFPHSNNKYT